MAEGRRLRIMPGLVALALVLLGAIWALSAEPPPLGAYRLPDGSVLRLDAVTTGPDHHFVIGRTGERLLAALLPPALKGYSGATDFRYQSLNRPAIILWLSGNGVPALMEGFRDSSSTVVSDERGSSVRAADRPIDVPVGFGPRSGPGKPPMRANEFVRGYPLPAFPRRGRTITLRIYGYRSPWQWVPLAGRRHGRRVYRGGPSQWVPVAAFTVPNPDPGPHPVWRPEPLPITRQSGDLEFTLTRLAAEADPPAFPSYSWPVFVFQLYPHSWTRADFRITRSAQPAPEWEPVGMQLSDATGNVMVPVVPVYYRQAGEAHCCFSSGLPLSETAWKVRAEFAPTSGFAPADLWTVHHVPVPQGSESSAFGASATRHGAWLNLRLRLYRISGRGPLVIEPQVGPAVDGLRVGLRRASDDRGRTWTPVTGASGMVFQPDRREFYQHDLDVISPRVHLSDSTSWRPPEPGRAYELRVPAGVEALSLTFAVVKSRFVEFLARPRRGGGY